MLFNPKNKKRFRTMFAVLAVLVVISMIILYIPVLRF
jgi:hypothetical protein